MQTVVDSAGEGDGPENKEEKLSEPDAEAMDLHVEAGTHEMTYDVEEVQDDVSGRVQGGADADFPAPSIEREETVREVGGEEGASSARYTASSVEHRTDEVSQVSDGDSEPIAFNHPEQWDGSVDSRKSSLGSPENNPEENSLFDAAFNRPRFRTIASVLGGALGALDDAHHTAVVTAAAEQILASIEERTEKMFALSNRIVQKLQERVGGGARVTSGSAKPRLRFGSVPTIVFEGAQSMYGQWQLREEEAAEAAARALREIALLAVNSLTGQRPLVGDTAGTEREEPGNEITEDCLNWEPLSDRLAEEEATAQEAEQDEECPTESACSRVPSGKDSPEREPWRSQQIGEEDQTEVPGPDEADERSEESRGRERQEMNEAEEEDVARMSDERAAKEFDLWLGTDRHLASDRGASPLSTARDRSHRSTGRQMDGLVPIPYDSNRRGLEPEMALGAAAGVAAKATAARELITASLKQEKLWRMFGRDTQAGTG